MNTKLNVTRMGIVSFKTGFISRSKHFTLCSDMHTERVVHTVTSRLQKVKQPGDVPVCVCRQRCVQEEL